MTRTRCSRYAAPIATAVLCLIAAGASAAPLQDVVFKVETQYHDLTRELFIQWADASRKIGNAELECPLEHAPDPFDFVRNLASVGDLSTTRFREINFADRQSILTRSEITTSFEIGSRKQDVVWTLEAGEWRISELNFAPVAHSQHPEAREPPSAAENLEDRDRSRPESDAEAPRKKSHQSTLMDRIRDG